VKIVHYQPQLRGAESGTANAGRGWSEALARRGVEVVGLVDQADIERPGPRGVDTLALEHSLSGRLRVPRRIAESIEDADVVVLHGGWLLGNITAGRACLRANVPFIVTTHGVYVQEVMQRRRLVKRVWAVALERRHLKRAAAVHVYFPEERVSMERGMKIRLPTIVAPNGIAIPGGVRWDGGSGGYLLWLGRFDIATKGLDLLLHALHHMPPSERPSVRLHGPDWRNQKQQVRTLAEDLRLDRWVTLGDPIYGDEKWELMRMAAGSIYPSRWDACPVAVSEAAAIGVPTLVTRYPLANLLASNGAAIQVDADASSIARGIQRLLSVDAAGVGSKAAVVARSHLSWDAVADSWLQQLTELLGIPR
jgi:glycosyltransferase involved in cell wall biosynthesis